MENKQVKKAGAQPGNKFAVILKDPVIRQKAFESYLEWIASGKPKQSWYYKEDGHRCCYKTMDHYIRDYPDEFPTTKVEEAKAKQYNFYLDFGLKLMQGQIEKGSPVVFQIFMRNMFSWDKEKNDKEDSEEPMVRKLAKLWRGES